MRALSHSTLVVLVVFATAVGLPSARAVAQGMGGGMPSMPASMFGNKKQQEEVPGISLSATDEPVAEIRVLGNKSIPTTKILNELQTRVGRPFDPALVQRDVRRLMQRSWFVDVQPKYEETDKGRVVIFTVVERPVIRYIQYLGNEGIRDRKLIKETDLKVGGSVDPYAVEEARRKIIDLYHRSGYNNAEVTIQEGGKATDQGIVFVINEGEPQKVWDVEFVGNEFVSSARLKKKIDSKPPLMYVFKGFVDVDQIDADVDKLIAYYRSFGYFQAKVGRQLIPNEKGNWVTLRFVVNEGPRYQVQDVAFIGNKLFATPDLVTAMKMPAGEPFEQAKMNADVSWLKELYGSKGYVFSDIHAETIFLEETGKLKVLYHIDEGRKWRVGHVYVHINGENAHTRIQTAMNRLSIRPGEIIDIREVHASERRLQASSLFMSDPVRGIMPKITYRIQDMDDELAKESSDPKFRGQSPDGFQISTPNGTPAANSNAPPLLPPPGYLQTYEMPTPAGFKNSQDQVDVHLVFEGDASKPIATVSPVVPPTAQRHEVRYQPYGDNWAPPAQPQANAAPVTSPYQKIVVRTQSPYQPPSPAVPQTATPGAVAPAYYQAPVSNPPAAPQSAAGRYAAPAYGGQAIGATGPDATQAGANPYAVQQAASTEPVLSPPPGAAMSPAYGAPQAAPAFGPPPMIQQGQPYAPAPGQAQGQALPPDPGIAPIPYTPPSMRNPQPQPPNPMGPFTPMFDEPLADLYIDVNEAQTGRLMLGVAVNSDAGLVGQILLDEQNFDWTRLPNSWDDFTSGRAFRGDGQRFRIEAMPGTEVQRYLVSWQQPYWLDSPVSLGLSGSYFDRRYADYDEQRLGGRVAVGYQWTANDLSANVAYRGENVNIRNISNPSVPELAEVEGDNVLHGFKLTVANDTRDNPFLATQGHYLELSAEQVVGSFQYPRGGIDARQYFLLHERPDHSGRHVLSASTQLGFTGNDTPIYENYFAGGFSTLRGFDFRGVGPVEQGVQLGGEFMWVNSLEYLFPLTADDMIHGVLFTDFGTVEENIEVRNVRVAPGFGLRITVPAMGPAPIALDFAFPINKTATDDTQVFSFFIGLQR